MKDILRKRPKTVFFLLLFLVLIERIWVLLNFAFVYTDSDQTLLWQAVRDITNGEFHGYCFYGQAYNPLVEPLLAAPLVLIGVKSYIALPIITSILALTPFILLAFSLRRRYETSIAILSLVILLLMPPEFGMLTSISRGFVQGIFFGTIGTSLIIFRSSKLAMFIGGFCLGLAYFANPNSVLLFPLLLPAFLEKKYRARQFVYMLIGGVAGLIPYLINKLYYDAHPEMSIHGSLEVELGLTYFIRIINSLDNYFDFISPVFWMGGWITLFVFPVAAIYLYRKKATSKFVTVVILFAVIILSFFVSKVADGTNSVFFSGARVFLAYPIIMLFIFIWCLELFSPLLRKRIVAVAAIVSVFAFVIKLLYFDEFLHKDLKGSKYAVVMVIKVKDLKDQCERTRRFVSSKNALVVATSENGAEQVITYGCPCLVRNFPVTIQPVYERRTWVRKAIKDSVFHSVLLYGRNPDIRKRIDLQNPKVIKQNKTEGLLLIENNQPTEELLHSFGF
jgi:hypothetical protein